MVEAGAGALIGAMGAAAGSSAGWGDEAAVARKTRPRRGGGRRDAAGEGGGMRAFWTSVRMRAVYSPII